MYSTGVQSPRVVKSSEICLNLNRLVEKLGGVASILSDTGITVPPPFLAWIYLFAWICLGIPRNPWE